MHQLESHLSYRIGLRTFSAMESRGVLGVPDAYELPSQPGSGYLKSGIEALTRFRAAYVSGPYRRRGGAVAQARVATQVVPWSTGYIVPRAPAPAAIAAPEPEAEESTESLLAVALDRLRDSGPPAHRVWLPPLDTASPLDTLLGGLAEDPDRGLTAHRWNGAGKLRVPVGLVDKPFDQRRDPLVVDLAGAGGHVAVAGRIAERQVDDAAQPHHGARAAPSACVRAFRRRAAYDSRSLSGRADRDAGPARPASTRSGRSRCRAAEAAGVRPRQRSRRSSAAAGALCSPPPRLGAAIIPAAGRAAPTCPDSRRRYLPRPRRRRRFSRPRCRQPLCPFSRRGLAGLPRDSITGSIRPCDSSW
ncbi:hypothetical protein ACRAWF_27910 [Streptomyces sp. L7]